LKPHVTSAATELSWTCSVIAAAAGAGARCLASISTSPIDALSILGALSAFGTFSVGSIGALLGVVGAFRSVERASVRILPVAINVAVVVGLALTIHLLRPGPSFRGGPAGF
jgi:hypothetical protein